MKPKVVVDAEIVRENMILAYEEEAQRFAKEYGDSKKFTMTIVAERVFRARERPKGKIGKEKEAKLIQAIARKMRHHGLRARDDEPLKPEMMRDWPLNFTGEVCRALGTTLSAVASQQFIEKVSKRTRQRASKRLLH